MKSGFGWCRNDVGSSPNVASRRLNWKFMKILVFAKPGARRASIEKMENLIPGFDGCFSIAVKEPAEDGRANHAVEAALAGYFKLSVSSVKIISGKTARKKIVLIAADNRVAGAF